MSKFYRDPATGRVYGETIATPKGRFSWPHMASPKADKSKDGKDILRYEITLLLPKEDPKVVKFLDDLSTMIFGYTETEFGTAPRDPKGQMIYGGVLGLFNKGSVTKVSFDSLLKDGDNADHEKYPYYANHYILLARRGAERGEVDLRGPDKKKATADKFVGGVKGILILQPHCGPTGLSFKMEGAQWLEDDGTRFGGGIRSIDKFLEAVSEEETSDENVNDSLFESADKAIGVDYGNVVSRSEEADAVTAKETIRAQFKTQNKPTASAPLPSAPINQAAKLRADAAAKMKVKEPTGSKVVTTGKGKALALNNL